MCKYCEKGKKIEEVENDNIYFHIYGKHLRVTGRILNIPLGRDVIIEYYPMCRKEAVMNIDDYKPVNNVIRYTVVFYEEPSKKDTWGSNDVMYEIYYNSKDGIMQVHEIEAFGDSTLVAMYQDRRGRGITLKEMLENIEEISNMTYKEFQEKIIERRLGE